MCCECSKCFYLCGEKRILTFEGSSPHRTKRIDADSSLVCLDVAWSVCFSVRYNCILCKNG